jgi:hypothetical protein
LNPRQEEVSDILLALQIDVGLVIAVPPRLRGRAPTLSPGCVYQAVAFWNFSHARVLKEKGNFLKEMVPRAAKGAGPLA